MKYRYKIKPLAQRKIRSFYYNVAKKYKHKKGLGISEVVAMYYPLQEADLSKFASAADNIIARGKS